MARIRSIKPEFWTSEQIMECSPLSRLLFIGLWNFCDDKGVHPVAYKTLKAEVFPGDDITSTDVEKMVGELVSIGLLSVFEKEGRQWWHVTGWRHQLINRPSKSRYPEPPCTAPLPSDAGSGDKSWCESAIDNVVLTDDSLSIHGVLTDDSLTERRGEEKEGKGVNPSLYSPQPPKEIAGTRKGIVCGLLRKAGMADSAPHYLTDEVWETILAKRTDEEIVEVARAKMATRPNERIGLKYIAKALLDDPQPIDANARASPGARRRTVAEEREAVSIALTGRKPIHERPIANAERDITGESIRVA